VSANSAWPTDSSIMYGLAKRTLLILNRLHKRIGQEFDNKLLTRWIAELDKLDFEISMLKSKKNAEIARQKLYRQFLEKIEKFSVNASQEMVKLLEKMKGLECKYSENERRKCGINIFAETVNDMVFASEYCYKRIFEEDNISSREKILSLADGDAAFIIKGGRDTILGYKPQVAVSDNMFVTSVIVPEGNAADSDMLTLTVEDSMTRTGVTPKVVSTDDGYVSKDNNIKLKEWGIDVVSFGGSKGKRLLGEEVWNKEEYVKARNDRSKAESIMFSLKYLFDFGQLKRRGVDEARVELTMKAVIYNFYHMAAMRKREKPTSFAA
jgi:hypothetical protein